MWQGRLGEVQAHLGATRAAAVWAPAAAAAWLAAATAAAWLAAAAAAAWALARARTLRACSAPAACSRHGTFTACEHARHH